MITTDTAYGENSKKTHTVGPELIRLLDPKEDSSNEGVDLLRSSTSAAKLASLNKMAARFLNLVRDLIPRRLEAGVHEELTEIMHIAADFCAKISAQKNSVRCDGLSSLSATFSRNSHIMEAHCLHSVALRLRACSRFGRYAVSVHCSHRIYEESANSIV